MKASPVGKPNVAGQRLRVSELLVELRAREEVERALRAELDSHRARTKESKKLLAWVKQLPIVLTTLTTVGALIYTGQSLAHTEANDTAQHQLVEDGQITDRFNVAITNLGSSNEDVRLGGIYALQRIMQDSSRDEPVIIHILAAFIRDHTNAHAPHQLDVPTDVQAAVSVLNVHDATRNTESLDLEHTGLYNANLAFADFNRADFLGADLDGSNLNGANLAGAEFFGADLSGIKANGTNLKAAELTVADLSSADLTDADLTGSELAGADLFDARLNGANLMGADLTSAHNLEWADLSNANLAGANLYSTYLCVGEKPSQPSRGYKCTFP